MRDPGVAATHAPGDPQESSVKNKPIKLEPVHDPDDRMDPRKARFDDESRKRAIADRRRALLPERSRRSSTTVTALPQRRREGLTTRSGTPHPSSYRDPVETLGCPRQRGRFRQPPRVRQMTPLDHGAVMVRRPPASVAPMQDTISAFSRWPIVLPNSNRP